MAIKSFAEVSAAEITFYFKLSHVDSVKGKNVMVNEGVVPRGSRAVVSRAGAFHLGVVHEPAGKVIDTLPQPVGDIQEKPVKELNTKKRSGNLAERLGTSTS
jgi:hypothetical protein